MISPFLKSAAVVLANRAIVRVMNSASFAIFFPEKANNNKIMKHQSKKPTNYYWAQTTKSPVILFSVLCQK
jgi:hypothetical protein